MLDHQALHHVFTTYQHALNHPVRTFTIGGRLFDFNRYRYLVGVINLSTDSWYRESVCPTTQAAIARAEMLANDGADLIDLGAESTLPEARRADIQQQLDRLLPVIEALKARNLLISVESYYPEVLETCAQAGADIFNLTGLRYSQEIFRLAVQYDVAMILCYVQGETVREVTDLDLHQDMIANMCSRLRTQQHVLANTPPFRLGFRANIRPLRLALSANRLGFAANSLQTSIPAPIRCEWRNNLLHNRLHSRKTSVLGLGGSCTSRGTPVPSSVGCLLVLPYLVSILQPLENKGQTANFSLETDS
jgi:hypothetical protein